MVSIMLYFMRVVRKEVATCRYLPNMNTKEKRIPYAVVRKEKEDFYS